MAPPQTRAISLRNVTPIILENPIHLEELKQDLARMRCEGLLDRPWALKREQLVQKMLKPKRPNIFDGTIQDRPQLWTADLWRDTYRFPKGGSGLSNRMEGHHEGRFMHQVDPKDGYSVSDCRVNRNRRLLEFLIPIVHPDKLTRVTITIGNTIFGALDGSRLPGYDTEAGEGGWKAQTHPHLSLFVPYLRGPRSAHSRGGTGLPDSQGDGRIPDHPGSGLVTRIRRGRTGSSPSTLSTTWAIANAHQEEEVHVQGSFRIATSPVQGTIKSGSTGPTAKGAATGESTGGRTGVGGQAFRQHRTRIPASSESIRINGDGVGADRL